MIDEALSPAGTAAFPAVIPYEGIYIRDHWDGLTGLPWWYAFSPDIDQQMAWRREVLPAIGQDWLALPFCNSRAHRAGRTIIDRDGAVSLFNYATGQETPLTRPAVSGWDHFDQGYSGHVVDPPCSPEEIDQWIPSAPAVYPEAVRGAGHADLADAVRAGFPDLYPLYHVTSPLWGCYGLWGYEGLMERIARQPDLVAYACMRNLHNEMENARLGAALGARGIWLEECLTDQIHPRDYRSLNLPYLQALIEEIHGLGMHTILYYCGSPHDRLDLLLSSGADALAFEESKKGFTINLETIAEIVDGRCALLGNLDAIHLLPEASEDELHAALACQANAGRRNHHRFIHSLGSPVTPETSPEQVRRFCQMAKNS
jgi:hypothetical protein